MNMTSTAAVRSAIELVCPACHKQLQMGSDILRCDGCQQQFPVVDGIPDLILGDRYDVSSTDDVMASEETTNCRTVLDYYVPLFHSLFAGNASPRILSLGCGVGADVAALCEAGFDAFGIDNGVRSSVWQRRECADRLFMADGKHMPFPDGTFDCVFCGCVFPHVGVQGSSYNVTSDYWEQRSQLASEIARVLKPGGKAVMSNPNRLFPFDIFHEHTANNFRMRFNRPSDPILLSRGDYQKLFTAAGCESAVGLPVSGYWSFTNSRKTLNGRIASAPVRFLFWLVSAFKPLRASFLNPWIIILIEKRQEVAD